MEDENEGISADNGALIAILDDSLFPNRPPRPVLGPSLLQKRIFFGRAVTKLDLRALSYGGAVYKDVHRHQPSHGWRVWREPRPLTCQLLSLSLVCEDKQVSVVSAKFLTAV
ncbi:MAG TPA: hypothetical protein VFC58_05425 [Desulfosporosinus sp.]|nr:hypothetical protein [Desulfosporosinus sp.]